MFLISAAQAAETASEAVEPTGFANPETWIAITWLIVVVISGLSYGAYVIERLLGSRSSLYATAILGGIYSSTSTTVVLAKRSAGEKSSAASTLVRVRT